MGLDVPYAIELCAQLSPLGLKWMEEYLIPDDYKGHTAVSDGISNRSISTLLATGEHEYQFLSDPLSTQINHACMARIVLVCR